MTLLEKTKIIEALEKAIPQLCVIQDEDLHLDSFICNTTAIQSCPAAKEYLQSQRPTPIMNSEFTKHPQYVGLYFWWRRNYDLPNIDNDTALLAEKRKFLTHIINKLK